MKFFLQTVFGIFSVTAIIMAVLIYFFGENIAAYAPAENNTQTVATEISEIENPQEESEHVPVISVDNIWRDTSTSLYQKLSNETLVSGPYDFREREFAALLRSKLATVLNMDKINCYVTVDNNIIYVDLEYKNRDDAYVTKEGLSENTNAKEAMKDIVLSISDDAKKAATQKDLLNTHIAVAYVDTIDDKALLISLNDRIFYDFYDSFQSPPDLTYSQLRAIADATQRLILSPYSKDVLMDRLTNSDLHSAEDAKFAIEYVERHNYVDWVDQAIRAAMLYLDANPFSKEKLIRQLASETGEQYPRWEANKAVEMIEDAGAVDWNYQALRAVLRYAEVLPYSQNEYMEHLTSENGDLFTWEQALYAVEYVNANGIPDVLSDLNNVKLFHSGLYKVGEDIDEGDYILFSTDDVNGYFTVSSDLAGTDVMVGDRFVYNSIVKVNQGEYLDVRHAIAVPLNDFYCTCHKLDLDRDHLMIMAGRELSPGMYKIKATEADATYTVYADSRHTVYLSDVDFSGTSFVVLKQGQCLRMDGCKVAFD